MRARSSQALINLLKNAAESIHARDGDDLPPGEIAVRLTEAAGQTALIVEDNGRGLPQEGRERLTEPYVTTRAKGTGLGLAIVKKIMEDHGGELLLEDREGGGARVMLVFHRGDPRAAAPPDADSCRRGREDRRPWRMTSSSSTTKPISAC